MSSFMLAGSFRPPYLLACRSPPSHHIASTSTSDPYVVGFGFICVHNQYLAVLLMRLEGALVRDDILVPFACHQSL